MWSINVILEKQSTHRLHINNWGLMFKLYVEQKQTNKKTSLGNFIWIGIERWMKLCIVQEHWRLASMCACGHWVLLGKLWNNYFVANVWQTHCVYSRYTVYCDTFYIWSSEHAHCTRTTTQFTCKVRLFGPLQNLVELSHLPKRSGLFQETKQMKWSV